MTAPTLATVSEKVRAGERLNAADALALFLEADILSIGQLANGVREKRHGNAAFFNKNMRLEVTNVCVASCLFCSFAKLEAHMPGAHTMSLAEAWHELEVRMDDPPGEIHVVNGLHPGLPFSYYEDLLSGFKRIKSDVHLKCFTAVEIHFFAQHYKMTVREVLERLVAAGLGSLPGGGAEIFAPEVRTRISDDKATGAEWLEVHRVAHAMGLKTNAGVRTCATCPLSSFTNRTNMTACLPWTVCAPGSYISTNGTTHLSQRCVSCPAADFSTHENAYACRPCTVNCSQVCP